MNNKIFSERHLNKVNQKLLLLGSNDNRALPYLTLKTVLIIVPCVVLMFISIYGLIAAPFIFILLYILTDYVVINREIKKRQIKLEKDGLLFFKVLYFNYINNRNLKVALKITTNNVANDLSKEFKKAFKSVLKDLPGGSVNKNLPFSAGERVSTPRPGKFPMLWRN